MEEMTTPRVELEPLERRAHFSATSQGIELRVKLPATILTRTSAPASLKVAGSEAKPVTGFIIDWGDGTTNHVNGKSAVLHHRYRHAGRFGISAIASTAADQSVVIRVSKPVALVVDRLAGPVKLASDALAPIARIKGRTIFSGPEGTISTDGTSYSTQVLSASAADVSTSLDGQLYFANLSDDSDNGLWRTDGTRAGTKKLRLDSPITSNLLAFGNRLCFLSAAPNYIYDLTGKLTLLDPVTLKSQSFQFSDRKLPHLTSNLILFRGSIYFTGIAPDAGDIGSKQSLYRFDGSQLTVVTQTLGENGMGIAGQSILLYDSQPSGLALVLSDGTPHGTRAIQTPFYFPTLYPIPGTSTLLFMDKLNSVESAVYSVGLAGEFHKFGTFNNAIFLGTAAGYGYLLQYNSGHVSLVRIGGPSATVDVIPWNNPPASSSGDWNALTVGQSVYFAAPSPSGGSSLFTFSGQADAPLQLGPDFHDGEIRQGSLTKFGDRVLFLFRRGPKRAWEIWQTNGTPGGTRRAQDLAAPPIGDFDLLSVLDGELYIVSDTGPLWEIFPTE